ncbi:hypothetical protein [Sphingopyxis terrae]|jgi:hypothetical protein|uniref:hypothetical protein n=1 Tax=Sphingopyxis terrae TaxID=33052 RepID=UPI003F7EEA4F
MSRADRRKDSGIGSLSAGEIDYLKAVGEGLASKEIARVRRRKQNDDAARRNARQMGRICSMISIRRWRRVWPPRQGPF